MDDLKTNQEKSADVSLVIPAYNEQNRLGSTLEKAALFFREKSYDTEVIVVDDGSTDSTPRLAGEFKDRFWKLTVLQNEGNRGKGYSVRRGMLAAEGKYRLFYDADGSTPIEEFDRAHAHLEEGYHMVIGSRAMLDSKLEIKQPFHRRISGDIFRGLVDILAVAGFRDTQCGFKCFTAEAAQKVFPLQRLERFSFDAELLYIAVKMGYLVKEMPVVWRDSSETKLNFLKDGLRMLWDLLVIRLNAIRGRYKSG